MHVVGSDDGNVGGGGGGSGDDAVRDIPAPGLRIKDFEGDEDFVLPVVRAESSGVVADDNVSESKKDTKTSDPVDEVNKISEKDAHASEEIKVTSTESRVSEHNKDTNTDALVSKRNRDTDRDTPVSEHKKDTEADASVSGCRNNDTKTDAPVGEPDEGDTSSSGCTCHHWGSRDIARFSCWDKTNVMVAGSRCLALLILIVP